MSRRTLLSAEQRDRLFAIPVERAEMARHYLLGADDLALIRFKRRGMNRLGFAVQLCLLRYPGQGLGPGDRPPEAMIMFVAEQVGVPPSAFTGYALRDQTRREHAAELQAALGMRRFGFADWRACLRVGTDAAWATDRGEAIVRAMLALLRTARVLIPAATVLERIGLEAVGLADALERVCRSCDWPPIEGFPWETRSLCCQFSGTRPRRIPLRSHSKTPGSLSMMRSGFWS